MPRSRRPSLPARRAAALCMAFAGLCGALSGCAETEDVAAPDARHTVDATTDARPTPDARGPDAALPDARVRDASGGGDGQPDAEPGDAEPADDFGPDAEADAGGADAGLPDGGGPAPDCRWPQGRGEDRGTVTGPPGQATLQVLGDPCARQFVMSTTAARRDDLPANPRNVAESAAGPHLRSRNAWFDALYTLARVEAAENGVDSIRDFAFNDGNAVRCPPGGCFETGRKWNYVWTRDTAYSMDLGLAALDPTRARNSLEFKLSERRSGGDLQIVQDTGTGGSYPVSSDRVVWSLGARTLLGWLRGAERTGFASLALEALRNTLEHDRAVVFDAEDGLYRGEQSFLDWREQSYPAWVAEDVGHIGMSKALGTNVGHLSALRLAAELAGAAGDADAAGRYAGWAEALRVAIRDRLWQPDRDQLAAFTTTTLDPSPALQFDTLGTALAVLHGVLSPAEAAAAVAALPQVAAGPSAIWPQQQQTPIYHNRAQWPFVTAYLARAAAAVNNPEVLTHAAQALLRGAALNLSHMENLELVTGAAFFEDGAFSGPVVNSQRQLWSVAAYVSLVHQVVFGLRPEGPGQAEGLRFAPYLTTALRRTWFAQTDELVLADVAWGGGTLDVVLVLPAADEGPGDAGLVAGTVSVDGAELAGALAPAPGHREVRINLVPAPAASGALTPVADTAAWRTVYAPRVPRITALNEAGGRLTVQFASGGDDAADLSWEVLRDGAVVAHDLPGATAQWRDDATDAGTRSPCYTVRARFVVSGNVSQHAPPMCYWGADNGRIVTFGVDTLQHTGGQRAEDHGRPHIAGWGDPEHRITGPEFVASRTGLHLIQATYGNGAGASNTGITCGVQRAVVQRVTDGMEVGGGYLVLPHAGSWDRWLGSNFVPVQLTAGERYRVVVGGPDVRAVNMSAFEHFATYTGGEGGRSGTFNRVNIADLKVLSRAPSP